MAQKNPLSQTDLVLIVDDDEVVVEITAEILEILGYDVLTARNGHEAIQVLRNDSRVSVLFTDVQMPGVGGEELAQIAVTLRPGIRVIFTSGVQSPTRDAAFVPKPYRAVDLIRVLPPQPLATIKHDPERRLADGAASNDHLGVLTGLRSGDARAR